MSLLLVLAACQPVVVEAYPPVIADLRAEQVDLAVTVSLDVEDPEEDVDGGHLALTWNGVEIPFAIGTEALWDPPTLTAVHPVSPCDENTLVDLSAVVSDAAGNDSDPFDHQFRLDAAPVFHEVEPNDNVFGAQDRGSLDPRDGVAICGSLSSSGDGDSYTGDMDTYLLLPTEAGTLQVRLEAASPDAAFDVWVILPGDDEPHFADGPIVTFDLTFEAYHSLYLGVAAFAEPHGDYLITFEGDLVDGG